MIQRSRRCDLIASTMSLSHLHNKTWTHLCDSFEIRMLAAVCRLLTTITSTSASVYMWSLFQDKQTVAKIFASTETPTLLFLNSICSLATLQNQNKCFVKQFFFRQQVPGFHANGSPLVRAQLCLNFEYQSSCWKMRAMSLHD